MTCTSGARQILVERYPSADHKKFSVISNGYDEQAINEARQRAKDIVKTQGPTLSLLHSGVLYPGDDRNPKPVMEAVRILIDANEITPGELQIVFRASGHDDLYAGYIRELGLESFFRLEAPVDYAQALEEMFTSDGLLLFQGFTSNPAIPAKLYEYLAVRKPVFALVDEAGDSAALLRQLNVGIRVPIDDPVEIAKGLRQFVQELRAGTGTVLEPDDAKAYSRYERTRELARILERH